MGKNLYEELPKHLSFVEDDMSEMYEYIGEVERGTFNNKSALTASKSKDIRQTVSSNLRAASSIETVENLRKSRRDNSFFKTSQASITLADKSAIAATNFPLNRITPLLK